MSPRTARQTRAQLPLSAHDLHILIALLDGPKHGYAIIQAIEHSTHGATTLGTSTVYAALKRMLRERLIAETPRPAGDASDDVRRRYYLATPLGREVAREAAHELARLHSLARRARLLSAPRSPRQGRS